MKSTHQANHISKYVFVGEDLSLLSLGELLKISVSLVQQQVYQITEGLLEQDRKHQTDGHFILQMKVISLHWTCFVSLVTY